MPNDSAVNHDTCMVTGTGPENFQRGNWQLKVTTLELFLDWMGSSHSAWGAC